MGCIFKSFQRCLLEVIFCFIFFFTFSPQYQSGAWWSKAKRTIVWHHLAFKKCCVLAKSNIVAMWMRHKIVKTILLKTPPYWQVIYPNQLLWMTDSSYISGRAEACSKWGGRVLKAREILEGSLGILPQENFRIQSLWNAISWILQ